MHAIVKKDSLQDTLNSIKLEMTKQEKNSIENKAVGIIGYRFVKEVGWKKVLEIANSIL